VAAKLLAQILYLFGGSLHRTLNYNLNEYPETKTITQYQNTILIYNPNAGKIRRSRGALVEQAAGILQNSGHKVTLAPTTGPRTAGEIARGYISSGADLIVVLGGDGVINEAVEGMVGSNVPLAVLPGGTANVLATEMRLGGLKHAAERLGDMTPRRVSVGRLTSDRGAVSRHFLLMAGIGLDAHIAYNVHYPLKARTGKFAYWVAGAAFVAKNLPQIQVEADGKTRECSFALFSKVRNYGGDFEIAREATLLDNAFEMVLFEGRWSTSYVKYLLGLLTGRIAALKGVTVARTCRARIAGPQDSRVYVQIDGESAGHLPAELEIVHDALTLLMPKEYGA
jgi:diacylglycerol kinase (ATP)